MYVSLLALLTSRRGSLQFSCKRAQSSLLEIAERSRKSLEWRRLIAFYSFILQKFFFQFSRPALRKSVKRPMFSS